MAETTGVICGGKPDHEHNDDWTHVSTFEGSYYTGPTDGVYAEVKQNGERVQMDSFACSICGSAAFNRDVYYGLE